MGDDIKDILAKRSAQEPPEFPVIRTFVQNNFAVVPRLSISGSNIIISMPSAAAAGSLRLELHKLKDQLDTKKRLIIRIGS